MIGKTRMISPLLIMVCLIAPASSCAVGRASETDARITASARDSYAFKTYLKDDDIRIRSENGMVTLTGSVSDESHKILAGNTVAGLPGVGGVKGVNNKMTVEGT